jgi:hypothetical protein
MQSFWDLGLPVAQKFTAISLCLLRGTAGDRFWVRLLASDFIPNQIPVRNTNRTPARAALHQSANMLAVTDAPINTVVFKRKTFHGYYRLPLKTSVLFRSSDC